MRNLQEQVKKTFCYQKLFWPFTVWINCSSDLKNFANSQPSASNFKSFSRSLEQFFLTVGQNNFGNKIPFLLYECFWKNIKNIPNDSRMVISYQNCSDLLWEKIVLVIENNFWNFEFLIWKFHNSSSQEKKVSHRYFVTKIVLTYCEKKFF